MTKYSLLLDEANKNLEPAMKELREAVAKKMKFIDEKKEEFLSAWIAETGCLPSEIVMIQQEIQLENKLATRIWFEKKPDDLPIVHRETEHKFGTWYPIEELKEFDKNVLFYVEYLSRFVIGQVDEDGVLWDESGSEPLLYELYGQYQITKWMPLPPRPEEGIESLAKNMVDIDPEFEKIFKENMRDILA
jgi:hypothetical protein